MSWAKTSLRGHGPMLALALLVCGCVFAAVAGPAESLHTRTQALHQTLDQLGSETKAVEATAELGSFVADEAGINSSSGYSNNPQPLTLDQLDEARTQLHAGLAGLPLPLGPGDWAGLTTRAVPVFQGYAPSAQADTQPKLEILYRDTLPANSTLVSGQLTGGSLPHGAIGVTVTSATAARFGLHPGSQLKVLGAKLVVTGIVRPAHISNTFWQADVTALAPSLTSGGKSPSYWVGAVFADADQLDVLQASFRTAVLMTWEFPLALGNINADQVQTLANRLNNMSLALPTLSGEMAAAANDITFSTGLQQPVEVFVATQTSVLAVLLVLFVSVIVVGAAVIVLAARMIADRRDDDLVMLRARGASARQVAVMLAGGTILAAVPAAALGVLLARVVVSGAGTQAGGSATVGWILAAAVTVLAMIATPLTGLWRHRRPGPARNPALVMTADVGTGRVRDRRTGSRAMRRIVAELTACGIAIAGVVVLHGQGVPANGGTNWFLTLAPILVAIPAAVIILRVYPLAIAVLIMVFKKRASATSYIALATSARSSLASTGPAFTLILALTLTAFAGMVSSAIGAGQVAASWQATGADAVINTAQVAVPATPPVERAIAAVPGVQHETAVWNTSWFTQSGDTIAVSAVDPAKYAALTAATPFPAVASGKLTGSGSVFDVLASPAAAAALGSGTVQLSSIARVGPIEIHIVGTVASTPAQTGGGLFILMPLRTLPGFAGTPIPNVVLVTGNVDHARLAAVGARELPGSSITFRSIVLASLQDSPLQHGAVLLMLLAVFAAAGFGLLNLVLGLAVGATERDLTFARLNVMGHAHGSRLAITETLPAVLAAAVGGLACALILPSLIAGALDLSVFTNSSASVTLTPDFVSLGLPAVAMIVLAVAALTVQTRIARRRGTSGMLRAH
jgi:putative ABC transport system permease protein